MLTSHSARRANAVLVSVALAAGLVAVGRPARALGVAAVPSATGTATDPGLRGTNAGGTGILPSFVRPGSTLIRLRQSAKRAASRFIISK